MYPVSPPGSFRLASLNYIWTGYTWEKGETLVQNTAARSSNFVLTPNLFFQERASKKD
jgi:hypothetical protein